MTDPADLPAQLRPVGSRRGSADLSRRSAPAVLGVSRVPAAVLVRNVSRTYRSLSGPVEAVQPLSVDVPAARLSTFAGPSGSGKSTLLRLCAALDRPTTGTVEVASRAGSDAVEIGQLRGAGRRRWRRERVGYVFQRPTDNLLPELTAVEHVQLAGRLRGATVARPEVEDLLALAGLSHRAGHRPGTMSGGEQQRLAVVSAVVGDPDLVVADEPTAELDSANGAAVLDLLRRMTDRGITVIVSSHDPAALAVSAWVAHLEHGRLVSVEHAS